MHLPTRVDRSADGVSGSSRPCLTPARGCFPVIFSRQHALEDDYWREPPCRGCGWVEGDFG